MRLFIEQKEQDEEPVALWASPPKADQPEPGKSKHELAQSSSARLPRARSFALLIITEERFSFVCPPDRRAGGFGQMKVVNREEIFEI